MILLMVGIATGAMVAISVTLARIYEVLAAAERRRRRQGARK